jgi:hypothetical protein
VKHLEPPRLLASLASGSPEARRLLDEVAAHEPTAADLDRLTARLASVLAPPPSAPPPAPGSRVALAKPLAKPLAVLGAALLAAVVVVALRPVAPPATLRRFGGVPFRAPELAAPVDSAGPSREIPEDTPPPQTEDVVKPAPRAPVRPAPTAEAVAAPESAPAQPGVDEAELLTRAHTALQQGDSTKALALVAEHEALSGTKLGQERERIAIEALLREGRRAAAVERADRFLARFPRSSYRHRIESLLAPPAPRDRAFDHKP